MGHPHAGQNAAGDIQGLAEHHVEAEGHQGRDRCKNFCLGAGGHALALHIGFQVVFVELRTQKPVVEFLRGLGKAKNRGQEEGDRGQDGQHDADAAQGQANAAQNEKNQPFYVHAVSSNAKIPGKLV